MPIFVPILLGSVAIAAGGYGAKKSYDGVSHLRRAREVRDRAKGRHERAVAATERARDQTAAVARSYDEVKLRVVRDTIGSFLALLEKLRQKGRLDGVDLFDRIEVSPSEVRDYEIAHLVATGTVGGAAKAVAAGAAASQGATMLVTTYASASTGTAIVGLSGAAAQNATLAWLGGGSLASGGWGMAGGGMVLGGLAIGPAIMVGGCALSSVGTKAYTAAVDYQRQVNNAAQTLQTARSVMKRVQKRFRELSRVLDALDVRARAAIVSVDPDHFDLHDERHLTEFRAAHSLVKSLGEVLRSPVLGDDGTPSSHSAQILRIHSRLLETP
jgi:hypothetical protein